MYPYIKIFILLNLSLLIISCNKTNPDLTPSYIAIDSIGFTTTSLQGTDSHNITDAWIYVDDQIQGVYELPCKFPVLAEGAHKITIRAGIKINGIASTRMYYPFYEPVHYYVNLVKDSTLKLSPTTTYNASVVFAWMENFEDGGLSLERTSKSQADIGKTSEMSDVFEGNYSGKILLDSNKLFFECYTIEAFNLNGNAINFLELNFKTNYNFYIGIFAYLTNETIQRSVLVLNETDTWKKIYVNLSNAVQENITAQNYKVFFGIVKDSTDSKVPSVFLDNIKLIHY
ncbi:MAG: hypothetical protein BWY70_00654 [Bacteroidetes bacterium ADurb.Bin408]|nr:MAG: hypothetical protein BWY70_00654 [Bacteroidetes bacterium ADurb.Bin408]